jgi:hypothetical protein
MPFLPLTARHLLIQAPRMCEALDVLARSRGHCCVCNAPVSFELIDKEGWCAGALNAC